MRGVFRSLVNLQAAINRYLTDHNANSKPFIWVLDNYGSHTHPKVRAWLTRHPRWVFHFTPTLASWLNAVEGFFAKLTRRRLQRTADPDTIIAAASRGYQALVSIG
jgi:transposase